MRQAWAEIDLAAIVHNFRELRDLAGTAEVCAVVKADGYGHGAAAVGVALVEEGASWLAVALVEEAAALRDSGIAARVLLLSQPPVDDFDEVVRLGLRPTLYSGEGVSAASAAARRAGGEPLPVHLKVDTGMHRVGVAPASTLELAKSIDADPWLTLEGIFTHCAVADEPGNEFTRVQLTRFEQVRGELSAAGLVPAYAHAANSAATISMPDSRLDMVRCGIALYGLAPSPSLDGAVDLRPAMSLKARVSYVKQVESGEAISYGQHYRVTRPTTIATVPIGYADGFPRMLGSVGGEVLVRGVRRPIAGTVTMDQITIDCGSDSEIRVGDEVVLLGRQGAEEITAAEWASLTDTISYEIVCGIGPRVPRRHLR